MNVMMPKEYKVNKKDIIIYTGCIVVCVVALTVIITIQIVGSESWGIGGNNVSIATQEEQVKLKAEFDTIFSNQFNGNLEGISKIEEEKEYVYTAYENKDEVTENYTLNVNIPEININEKEVQEINEDIEKKYKPQLKQILNSKGKGIIYSIEYTSIIENNILFLAIRSNLKEGNNAQQTKIDTYQYDIENHEKINLKDMIAKLGYNETEVQNKINSTIEREEQNSQNLKELGYSIYVRDSKSDMYKIENSKDFFMNNGKLYIIYSYGKSTQTSEIDLVIV